MLKSRPFQFLVTVLIALGMHVCCCQAALLSCGPGHGDQSGDVTAPCNHGHGGECDDRGPANPERAPHSCCGVHTKPLTCETSKVDVPPLGFVAVLPHVATFVEWNSVDLRLSRVRLRAPAPKTSLLQSHCALIV
jgi:hypothetical protein